MRLRGRHPRITITHDGETKSLREWEAVTGIDARTLRSRMTAGMSNELILFGPVKTGPRPRSPRPLRIPGQWSHEHARLRAAALADERRCAMHNGEKPPRDLWDIPIDRDPWSQAAIEVAAGNDGGFTLCEIGELMGVCRERVRQIESAAMRKIEKWARLRGQMGDMIGTLRELDAVRGEHHGSDE